MAGFNNQTVYANNVDFTGSVQPRPQVTADGQLLIGSAVSPNIRVATLTAGTGVSITNAAGSITIGLAGSGVAVEHLTGNTGGVLNPDGSNNFTIIGTGALSVAGVGSTLTISSSGPSTDLHTARFIVSAGGSSDGANYTTIASAITAASSGATIFIQPGTYTENFTLKPGVNLVANIADAFTPNVTILGKITYTGAGTANISGIRLQTNSDFFLEVSGSNACIIGMNNCYLNCSNNTGISFTNSNAASQINCSYSSGDIGTTGISLYAMSAIGSLTVLYSNFSNSGGSSTANSNSAGGAIFGECFFKNPIASTSTGATSLDYVNINTFSQNVSSLTITGTGTISSSYSSFISGSASAISIGSGATGTLIDLKVSSSNTNAITGAGTLVSGLITYYGSSSGNNVTTQTQLVTQPPLSSAPQVTVYTSGTGTYTTPTRALYLTVRMVGGGGGGAGSGTTPGAATAGNNSTFGTALLTCNGGGAGTTNGTQAAGGTATGGDINLTGGASGVAIGFINTTGGLGGCSFYGGIGQPGVQGDGPAFAAAANSGSGGGGAGSNATVNTGGGGGAGGYLEKLISSPLATYAYAVGGTAAGGTLGTGGAAGGLGAAGNIIVTAYFV